MAIFKKIFFVIFNSCFLWILVINLIGLLGIFGDYSSKWDSTTYYFGFTSFVNAFKNLPSFDISTFTWHLQLFYEFAIGKLFDSISSFITNGVSFIDVLSLLVWFLTWPFTTICYVIVIFVDLFSYTYKLILWFFDILKGNYNSLLPIL